MGSQLPPSADDWDSHWERYAGSAVQNPAQRMRHDLIAGLLRQRIQDREAKIFDVGSGQGDLLLKLDSLLPGASLLGGEISAKGVAISRRKVPRATFVVADVSQESPALNEGILRAAGYSIERISATGFPFFNLYRLFVIAGGNRLKDVKTDAHGVSSTIAASLMTMFNLLFRGNIRDSRFGWQLVAVAHKTSS